MFKYEYEVRFRRSECERRGEGSLAFTVETEDANDNLRWLIADIGSEYPDALFDGMRLVVTPV